MLSANLAYNSTFHFLFSLKINDELKCADYYFAEQWELTNHKGTELLTYFNGSCFNDVSCANTTSDLQDIWSQKNIGEAYVVLVEQLTLNGDLSEGMKTMTL